MSTLHFLLPNDIDDPTNPSGGNRYDRRVSAGLTAAGWTVREYAIAGRWPLADQAAQAAVGQVLAGLPPDSLVLIDGLIAVRVPRQMASHTHRLRLVVLLHAQLDDEEEAQALRFARAVVTTSEDSRQMLSFEVDADRIFVARPGVDRAPIATGTGTGTELLCVAAVTQEKGHDTLIRALSTVAELPWNCVCVGPLDRDRAFRRMRVEPLLEDTALGDRIRFTGPLAEEDLDAAYDRADLLVLASRSETYGMVVTEALARGIPVLTTDEGGLRESVGTTRDGRVPGLVVDENDFAESLRQWLTDADLRDRLRQAAIARRPTLDGWPKTVATILKILDGVRRA